jgi:hypothetical protein
VYSQWLAVWTHALPLHRALLPRDVFRALPRCLIGIEACATFHCWARELTKVGHQVRLMPAKDVKAYVKRNKNDAADAEAICEAIRRPTMRFVQIKSVEQQGQLMLHRARDLLTRQRTQLINALRAYLWNLIKDRCVVEWGRADALRNAGICNQRSQRIHAKFWSTRQVISFEHSEANCVLVSECEVRRCPLPHHS